MSIIIKNLNKIYDEGTPYETVALKDVNIEVKEGEFIGLIGHTGSGKSTLIQHLNGLVKPSSGEIVVNGYDISSSKSNLREVRKRVGLVFQYPEYQLFEETVAKDIAYGPTNLGLDEKEIDKRVRESMEAVGLNYDKVADKSPFELSGGQRRRVAIAGVIAMNPEVLILDEPTAGLDPMGREEILSEIKDLHEKKKITVILVSHSMDDISKIAEKIVVMDKGRVKMYDHVHKIFSRGEELKEVGLDVPQITALMAKLKEKGYELKDNIFSIEDAKKEILKVFGGKDA
ncbi:MAG: energy-coupling factor transporter ATPase [Firmicutes bacterium]|jgi:energy-coupling factor transport system ATP-binding protein|nr:energy-coupling factor transporter ATPase [Bacillota bacterium]